MSNFEKVLNQIVKLLIFKNLKKCQQSAYSRQSFFVGPNLALECICTICEIPLAW